MAFMNQDFLLDTPLAQRLYHEYAEPQPIIDYHCHLPPAQAADNHGWANLAAIWLHGDHYKWRAMRTNGIPERLCTGDASDWEKFQAWAATMPKCLRNPLYHWTHLELKKPFGITDRLLDPSTAKGIWETANAVLASPAGHAWGLMQQWKVEVVCTTDDPVDDLAAHRRAADLPCPARILPTFRPDRALHLDDPTSWNPYIDRLGQVAGLGIRTWDDLLEALRRRHDYFHATGCRLSDHGLEQCYASDYTAAQVNAAFAAARSGITPDPIQALAFKSALLHECALLDQARGWVQQLHLGALRNNNRRLFARLGPDTGFDSIGDWPQALMLSRFLDRLDRLDRLPRTIIYNLNPADNEVFATMLGNFQDGSCPGKIQYGSGWWFLDQWDGMAQQIEALSNLGLLSRFVGMLTDSRSFLSYARHEYFRRLLCRILAEDVRRGALPDDPALLGELVADVSYRNARDYFKFHEVPGPA